MTDTQNDPVVETQKNVNLWGKCLRCGHSILQDEFYCPSCGRQRDWEEVV